MPGRPDLVFGLHRKVVFVQGCFWHRHPACRKATTAKSRIDFWQDKFEMNVACDARTSAISRSPDGR
ncbi:very short patch repair endonuclease [Jiella pacifica]|uniref:very short patch repair endonuclease n=1 Tax=Jiella pacifica TaxID=2696469 RepID=UPI001FE908CB|nr:very short patch repair endonuclease [Jiella pacifica]